VVWFLLRRVPLPIGSPSSPASGSAVFVFSAFLGWIHRRNPMGFPCVFFDLEGLVLGLVVFFCGVLVFEPVGGFLRWFCCVLFFFFPYSFVSTPVLFQETGFLGLGCVSVLGFCFLSFGGSFVVLTVALPLMFVSFANPKFFFIFVLWR